jgi:thioredoxin-related protein
VRRVLAALLLSVACLPALASGGWEKFFTLSLNDLPAELAEARKAGKQGMLLVYQMDDCPYCERMKKDILSRTDVQKWYGERFAAYTIDIKGATELVDFKGRKTTEGRYAREALVRGTPTLDFYDIRGQLVARVPGEIRDAQTFLALGDWVASGAHARQTFEQYRTARGMDATPLKINQYKP